MTNYEHILADRTADMKASVIREILKVAVQPGMISLAGGNPAPESFPVEIIDELTTKVLRKYPTTALQYGPTEGFGPLREILVDFLARRGIDTAVPNISITSGSQGSLDAIGKIFISKGDCIAVEAPTYIGAISAFNPYQPTYIGLETDADGVIPEALDRVLASHRIKFVYVIPTFQNPTGRTIPLERRKAIAEIIIRRRALLIEDDPYCALRYRGKYIPPIQTMAPDNVVYLSTFSKILAPGLRIGFYAAPEFINRWLVLAKQGIDLHTNSFSQALAAEYIAGGYLDRFLPRILDIYRPRLKAMIDALQMYFPEGFTWSDPDGGMFVWVAGPKGLDTDRLYWKAVEHKVAYVPGQYCYTGKGEGTEAMRLNFTMVNEETIDRGIRRLADVFAEAMEAGSLVRKTAAAE